MEAIGLTRKIPFEAVMRMALVGRYERLSAGAGARPRDGEPGGRPARAAARGGPEPGGNDRPQLSGRHGGHEARPVGRPRSRASPTPARPGRRSWSPCGVTPTRRKAHVPSPRSATRSGLRRRLRRDRFDRRAVVSASVRPCSSGPGSRHGGRGRGLRQAVHRPSRHRGRRPTGRALALPCPPRRPRRAGRRASRRRPPRRREPPAGARHGSPARRPIPGAVTARAGSGDRRGRGAVHPGPSGRRGRGG